jgi:hypothetical protein
MGSRTRSLPHAPGAQGERARRWPLWLLTLTVAGCNADYYFCQASSHEPGRSGRASRCAVVRTAEEACRGLDLGSPPPANPITRTAGPYSQRDRCEQRGLLDSLFPPADAGRP